MFTAPSTTDVPAVIDLAGLKAVPTELVDPGTNRRGPIGDVTDLAQSIQALGQLEPVTLITKPGGRFEVFEGHRRRAAIIHLGLPHILAVVRSTPVGEHGVRQVAIHTQRKSFDPIAEALVCREEMFGPNLRSREEVAAMLGRTPEWVRDRVALLQLTRGEQAAVASGELSVVRALALLRVRRAVTNNGGTMQRTTRAGGKPAGPKLGENTRGGLLDTVLDACRAMGLPVYHTHNSRHSEAGFPDLVIVGPGGCLFRELKGDGGKVTAAQQRWVDALATAGEDAGVWWPDDLRSGRIVRELTALRRPRPNGEGR